MAELVTSDPSFLSTDVGPVIDAGAREEIEGHIKRLERDAKLIARAPDVDNSDGTFIRPAAFEIESLSDLKQEIFGPVLHVVRFKADRLDDLIDDINALGFGLTMGAHTRIDETMHAISRRARTGNLYINRNQIGAVVGVQPFGGEGLSGTGPKAGGPHYLKALTKRARPSGDEIIDIADTPLAAAADAQLNAANADYHQWNNIDRGAVLRSAAEDIPQAAQFLIEAAEIFDSTFQTAIDLPGPTGESNTLRLRGRGITLCLGGAGPETSFRQVALALAAGNCVITTDADTAQLATAIASATKGLTGGSSHPRQRMPPEAMLLDKPASALSRIDGGS